MKIAEEFTKNNPYNGQYHDIEAYAEMISRLYAEQYKQLNAELLEALKTLMSVYEEKGHLLSFDVNIAREAIKKAMT